MINEKLPSQRILGPVTQYSVSAWAKVRTRAKGMAK